MHVMAATTLREESSCNGELSPMNNGKPKLLEQMREAPRSRHYSPRTEQTYCHRVRRDCHFHNVGHPTEMAEPEINAFLTHLAVREKVAALTQYQVLSVLLFLYRHVFGREVDNLDEVIRAREPKGKSGIHGMVTAAQNSIEGG